jgi:hypothetical protein
MLCCIAASRKKKKTCFAALQQGVKKEIESKT